MSENALQSNQQELSIEKACDEYKTSVKLTLDQINQQLDNILLKNWNSLDELSMKIAARMNFLDKNPTFLSCLKYDKKCIKNEQLIEFDEIRITLKEHTNRLQEKLQETEKYHRKLLDLVAQYAKEDEIVDIKDEVSSNSFQKLPPQKGAKIKIAFLQDSSFDRVTIQKSAYSDDANVEQTNETPKFKIFDDIIPDVQRRRPMEDLHGKLIQQLVATDSLEGFLKLMDRKPSKRKTNNNLEEKYKNSLYFFPKKKKPIEKPQKPPPPPLNCKLLVTNSQPTGMTTNQEKTKKIRLGLARRKLKYYDLLDDIDYNDIKPIKSEYPRRDNIISITNLKEAKSYLARMMNENEKVWKTLLQPPIGGSTRKRKTDILNKSRKIDQNLIEYLVSPQQKILNEIPKNLIVMPVKVIYDNFPTKDIPTPRLPPLVTLTPSPPNHPDLIRANNLMQDLLKPQEDTEKRNEMLNQLRGLKQKNDHIQKNIQKAIDVIETKMIDLLSSPKDGAAPPPNEAFNAMEKEITNVLKMMNDEKKIVPEKDENQIKIPSPKSSSPIMRKKLRDKTPERKQITTQKWDKLLKDDKKRDKSPERKKDEKKLNKAIRIKKRESTPPDGRQKKAADIEEGEKLLGQVDSVIKKIDNIYSKISDEQKKKLKLENLNNINEFFNGLHPNETGVVILKYEQILTIGCVLSCMSVYYPVRIYYESHLLNPNTMQEKFLQEFSESEADITTFDIVLKKASFNLTHLFENSSSRHENTLNAFYTIFFSSVFMALNLDYVA